MFAGKKRLDLVVLEKGLVNSRQRAQALIMAGKVLVNNHIVDKPGTPVFPEDDIVLQGEDHPYVSRGGLKLEKALHTLGININGFVCLDVGASTGGFTDCLLQHGAGCVYAVDVGYGQLAWKLRQNPRVVVIERMNIRHMQPETLPQLVDLVTIDVSFISLKKVVPEILIFMKKSAGILALIIKLLSFCDPPAPCGWKRSPGWRVRSWNVGLAAGIASKAVQGAAINASQIGPLRSPS